MKRGNAGGGKDPGWSWPEEGDVVSTTETRSTTDTVLGRIAWLSARDALKRFDSLMHLFNQESLAACFHALDGGKAVGADGVLCAVLRRQRFCPEPIARIGHDGF